MDRVVIGRDPHKRWATIEAGDTREVLRATGMFGTDTGSYGGMLRVAGQWSDRVWGGRGRQRGGPAGGATAACRR